MKIINETSRKSKAKNLLTSPSAYRRGKHVVETFAILTANNPNAIGYDRVSNNKFNRQAKDLMSYDNPESIFKQFHFNYYKVKGKYGNREDSFLIYNLTLNDAKSLATRFQQQSFIFGKNTDDGLIFEFWANKSKSGYVYSKLEEKKIFKDESNAEDYYTQISREFKFSIPFDKFSFDDDEMIENYYNRWFTDNTYRENFNKNMETSLDEKYTFIGRAAARCRMDSSHKINEDFEDIEEIYGEDCREFEDVCTAIRYDLNNLRTSLMQIDEVVGLTDNDSYGKLFDDINNVPGNTLLQKIDNAKSVINNVIDSYGWFK